MTSAFAWLTLPQARRAAVIALLCVAAAYQIHRPLELDPTSPLLALAGARGVGTLEEGYAWTGDEARLVFPEPGPGQSVRLDLDIGGWRPRGQSTPLVQVRAGDTALSVRPERRIETISIETTTSGVYSSDLTVTIKSETFRPSPSDSRALGVRFRRARLTPLGPAVGLTRPPLRPLLASMVAVFLLFGLLVRLGLSVPRATAATNAAAIALGLAFVFARGYAAVLVVPTLTLTAMAIGLTYAARGLVDALLATLGAAAHAGAIGLRRSFNRWTIALAGVSAVALASAYLAQPIVEFDLTTLRAANVAQRFGVPDSAAGRSFRYAPRGARLDLSDFGAESPWRIEVDIASEIPSTDAVLLRIGDRELRAPVGPAWSTATLDARSPAWTRGRAIVEFPGVRGDELRVAHVRVDRGHSLPTLRACALFLAAVLTLLVTVLGLRVSRAMAYPIAVAAAALGALTIACDPLAAIPFLGRALVIVLSGAVLGLLLTGALRRRGTAHADAAPPPAALAATLLGFLASFMAAAFPLYRGGHFLFHSSIAREIWQGRFLIYYLPYPGSMLSRQAQWGNLIIPHPCLYHTLVAPLAALPAQTFYFVEKGVLALGLSTLVWCAVLIALRVGGRRAAVLTAVLGASMPPAYQMLGLGHLMTLLGCGTMTWAFTYILHRWQRLHERASAWTAIGLLTLAFLSYTAALLIGLFVLSVTVALWWRTGRREARALALVTLGACVLAFALYYVNWTLPFLRESVPLIFQGSHAATTSQAAPGMAASAPTTLAERLARVVQQPHKLTYTYGFWLFPLAGLAGTLLVRERRERILLAAWGASLIAFMGVDLFFNLLVKHHYFVMAPVAVGLALILDRAWERGHAYRWAVVAVLATFAALGAHVAVQAAWGLIP